MNIDEPTPEIEQARTRWERNRAFLSGEDAVKAKRCTYLRKIADMTDDEYTAYLDRVPFFAGAARIKDGLKGLIFRKAPTLDIADSLIPIFDTITQAGHTFNDLAEDLVEESLITGFTGLLVDHPASVEGLTQANAIARGQRPFIALYQAESILEVSTAVVNNVQMIVRVRLLDDENTVRELLLDEGVYFVIIHKKVEGEWFASDPIAPTMNGQPLNRVPFVLVTDKPRRCSPCKAPLDDVVQANKHEYRASAMADNSRYFSSSPMLVVKGAEAQASLVIAPGRVLQYPQHKPDAPVEIEYLEFAGTGQQSLDSNVQVRKDEMAMLGLRMLASEAKGVEAAETHAIRRASENSILAAFTRRQSDRLQEAAQIVADWLNAGEVSVNLNADFLPSPMSEAEMKQWADMVASGLISFETFCNRLIDGEKLPEDFDIEAEQERRAQNSLDADRPSNEEPPAA